MLKKVLMLSILLILFMPTVVLAGPRKGYGDPVCEYKTTFGLKIESYSNTWNTKEKLRQVYNELVKNYVSVEIQKLKVIYLYPDIEEGVNGYYDPDVIVKNDGTYAIGDNSYIVILGCDDGSTLSSISPVLAHEYGHHFTTYYLVTNEQKYGKDWINTRYAQLRSLNKFSQVKNYNPINVNRKWDIAEIAANDYVELFGASNNINLSYDYKDSKECADNGYYQSSHIAYNAKPQANLDLPLASHVPGLYSYWKKMAGGASSGPRDVYTSQLTLSKKFLVENKYNGYLVKWDTMAGGNYEYTVVMHPENNSDNIIPIKTVRTGEVLEAYIGSYKGTKKTITESFAGRYVIRLFIKDSDGFMYEGKSIVINFSEKLVNSSNYSSIFVDLLKNYWAYDYIISVYQKNIINGYVDSTFRPENTITRKEFLAMLMRTSKISLKKYKKVSDDWFIRAGYLDAAKAYGIVTENDYGSKYSSLKLNEPITREEMSFMIGRVLIVNNYTLVYNANYTSKFSDKVNSKYKTEINLVIKHGILSGYPDGTFKGSNNATRAEATKMIYKVMKLLK